MNLKRRLSVAAMAALTAVTLAGCGTPDPHEPAELNDIRELVEADEVWSVSLGESLTGLLAPAVTANGIYAAGENTVYKINPENGEKIWEAECASLITAGVGSDGRTVAVGTANGELEVFDAEGQRIWKVRLSSEMSTPPLVGSGFVIVRTADTRITAFDAASGERLWRYQSQIPALTVRAASAMSFSPAGVLAGQSGGRLLALNAKGQTVFDAVIAQPKGITEVERLCDVVGTPYADNNMMCAAAYQGNVVCMSSRNGQLVWKNEVDAVTGPASDGRNVYVVTARGEVNAYDYASGTLSWSNKDLTWRSPSAVAAAGKVVATGDYDGVIHFIDPATGEIIGRTELDGAVRVPPVPMPGGALFQTEEGELAYLKINENK